MPVEDQIVVARRAMFAWLSRFDRREDYPYKAGAKRSRHLSPPFHSDPAWESDAELAYYRTWVGLVGSELLCWRHLDSTLSPCPNDSGTTLTSVEFVDDGDIGSLVVTYERKRSLLSSEVVSKRVRAQVRGFQWQPGKAHPEVCFKFLERLNVPHTETEHVEWFRFFDGLDANDALYLLELVDRTQKVLAASDSGMNFLQKLRLQLDVSFFRELVELVAGFDNRDALLVLLERKLRELAPALQRSRTQFNYRGFLLDTTRTFRSSSPVFDGKVVSLSLSDRVDVVDTRLDWWAETTDYIKSDRVAFGGHSERLDRGNFRTQCERLHEGADVALTTSRNRATVTITHPFGKQSAPVVFNIDGFYELPGKQHPLGAVFHLISLGYPPDHNDCSQVVAYLSSFSPPDLHSVMSGLDQLRDSWGGLSCGDNISTTTCSALFSSQLDFDFFRAYVSAVLPSRYRTQFAELMVLGFPRAYDDEIRLDKNFDFPNFILTWVDRLLPVLVDELSAGVARTAFEAGGTLDEAVALVEAMTG